VFSLEIPVTDTIEAGRPPRTAVNQWFDLMKSSPNWNTSRWRRRHDSSSAIPPSASLYGAPKTMAAKPSWPLISPKQCFWSAAAGAKRPFHPSSI